MKVTMGKLSVQQIIDDLRNGNIWANPDISVAKPGRPSSRKG